jgi:hypothetical protein
MPSFLDTSKLSDGALLNEQTGSIDIIQARVQRGVERVLLAILERASSQGRHPE